VNNRRRTYSGAEQDFTLAIELDPENDAFYFSRGLARLRLKKKSEACADFRKSAGMGNEDAKHVLRDECR
jgi:Flp pilus assembly protein TadD